MLGTTHKIHGVTTQNSRILSMVAKRSSNLVKILVFYIMDCLTLEDVTETLVTNYKKTPRNIPEELVCQLQSGGKLKSLVL
jgi:hypothetical protein